MPRICSIKKTRMVGGQIKPLSRGQTMFDRADLAILGLDAVRGHHAHANPRPRLGRGRTNLQLSRFASQKEQVYQIGRREVGGEDQHRLERHP